MDEVVPPKGSIHYYNAVSAADPNVHDYYRFFEAPMMGHCYGGVGGYPSTLFDSLVAWVESGTPPDSLPVSYSTGDGTYNRILCPYPEKVHYNGTGNTTSAGSFYCSA